MSHTAVRLAPVLAGAVLVMAACSPACAGPGVRSGAAASGATSTDGNPDFVVMEVLGVLPTSEGHAVFLVSEPEQVVLPIWIGGAEALAIQLRLERRRFERPLTHDLLDTVVRELGGHVTKIQVDGLKGSTFVGTVFVSAHDEELTIDARPSDAIALAVGNRVPILVARQVVDDAGLTKDEMEAGAGEDPAAPGLEPAPGLGPEPGFEEEEPAEPFAEPYLEVPEEPPTELHDPFDPDTLPHPPIARDI